MKQRTFLSLIGRNALATLMEESLMNCIRKISVVHAVRFAGILLLACGSVATGVAQSTGEDRALQIEINPTDGTYTIAMSGSQSPALRSGVGVEVNGRWLRAADYPRRAIEHSQAQGYLGKATDWQVVY